jgi:hypothetical protein
MIERVIRSGSLREDKTEQCTENWARQLEKEISEYSSKNNDQSDAEFAFLDSRTPPIAMVAPVIMYRQRSFQEFL